MKKNILVKVGERTETRARTIPAEYDEMGEILAPERTEEYTVTVPIMEAQNVEMTEDEIEEMRRLAAEVPIPAPTVEERLDALEPTTDDLVEIIADQEYRLCLMELGITEEEVSE